MITQCMPYPYYIHAIHPKFYDMILYNLLAGDNKAFIFLKHGNLEAIPVGIHELDG